MGVSCSRSRAAFLLADIQWWLVMRLWRRELKRKRRRLLTEYDHRLLFGRRP